MKTLDEILQEKKRRKEQEEKAEIKRLKNVSQGFSERVFLKEISFFALVSPLEQPFFSEVLLHFQMSQVSPKSVIKMSERAQILSPRRRQSVAQ